MQTLVDVFRSISSMKADDGMTFDPASVSGSVIRKETGHGGVRIELRASLDGARMGVQIDIGFGDVVTPAAQHVQYPTLLPDLPAPTLRAYTKATAAAEKLHAVTVLGMTNSRMKDFFDLVVLLNDKKLANDELARAIKATFDRRQTAMPKTLPIGLSDAFATDASKQVQWNAFLRKNGLAALDLADVIRNIRARAVRCGFAPPIVPHARDSGTTRGQATAVDHKRTRTKDDDYSR